MSSAGIALPAARGPCCVEQVQLGGFPWGLSTTGQPRVSSTAREPCCSAPEQPGPDGDLGGTEQTPVSVPQDSRLWSRALVWREDSGLGVLSSGLL